jgi:hypothetical protein
MELFDFFFFGLGGASLIAEENVRLEAPRANEKLRIVN